MSRLKEFEIDLAEPSSPRQLHHVMSRRLNFPDYYGSNWDAFWDVIVSEDVLPELLLLRRWPEFEAKMPRDAMVMRQCLTDYQEERPDWPCRVVYA